MRYLNETFAVEYNENNKWTLARKDSVVKGEGFDSLLQLLKSIAKDKTIVVWTYCLSRMVLYAGKDNFDDVTTSSGINKDSFVVKFAKIGENIIFKSSQEFYPNLSLADIAKMKQIDSENELTIVFNAAEDELNKTKYVCDIPFTSIGYIKREIRNIEGITNEFRMLARSITKESHDLISNCISGPLTGYSSDYLDQKMIANCYDFKSFYPWIMCTQEFPFSGYKMIPAGRMTIDALDNENFNLWIAEVNFKYIKPKTNNWLKIDTNTVIITNLDWKIIKSDYDYEVESVGRFIPFSFTKLLPEKLRKLILDKFETKEKAVKDSSEYVYSKQLLNCIYGLYNVDQKVRGGDIQGFTAKLFPLVIGRFVVAYGRYYLWEALHDTDAIIWDTDGFKTTKILDLTKYSNMTLGRLVCENKFAMIKVFGNKQYQINDKLKLAGTDGELAMKYFKDTKTEPTLNATIPAEYTNKYVFSNNKIIPVPYTLGKEIMAV